MIWVLGGFVALIAAYLIAWQWNLLPRETISFGTATLRDGRVLKTREYLRSYRKENYKSPAPGAMKRESVWEVELPSGRWIECDGEDCAAAAERALK